MSALAYSGVGLVVLTAAGLAKKGQEALARKRGPKRLAVPARGTQPALLAVPCTRVCTKAIRWSR